MPSRLALAFGILVLSFVAVADAVASATLRTNTFNAAADGEATAIIHATCARCAWDAAGREASVLTLSLDGRYSRMSGKGTVFGAFLDSTLDRIEEGIVLTAVAGYFAVQGNRAAAAAVVVAVLASLMVSYTRARAEALGVECKVGIATRPVRVVILAIGLIFAKGASLGDFELLQPAVYVLAALSLITVAQRIWHVRAALSV